MSIVGTRPPLISETNLYEPRHLGYDQNRRSAFVPNEEIRQELTLAVRKIVV